MTDAQNSPTNSDDHRDIRIRELMRRNEDLRSSLEEAKDLLDRAHRDGRFDLAMQARYKLDRMDIRREVDDE